MLSERLYIEETGTETVVIDRRTSLFRTKSKTRSVLFVDEMTLREKELFCTINHWFVFQYLFIYVHRVLSIQRALSACSTIDFPTVKIDLMPLVMKSHTNYEGCSGLRTDNRKLKPRMLIENWKLFW